jgi:RimJ/RimL family protein N-acetyltransferase
MQQIGTFTFYEMDEASARQIATWQYEPPYDIYNCHPNEVEEHVQVLLKPEYHYYTVWNAAGELIAFRCFGEDAQVPGGDYRAEALDMGGGLRPDLTGQGLGARVIEAAFEFARRNFAPKVFRVTVAAFNQRALRVCEKVGYRPVQTFQSTHSSQDFVVLMREVG